MIQKERGHTLPELLIALSLSLFLSSAVINIFIQCKETAHLIQHLDKLQTSARIAFNWLSRDIRMAGLIGCVRLRDFYPLNVQLTPSTSLVIWHNGYATTSGFPLPKLKLARPQSDIILIQSLDPNTFSINYAKGKYISLLERPLFHSEDQLLISDCQHAEAFRWGHANLVYTYQNDSELGFLDKIIYYVGNTGRRTQKGKVVYALYRRNLNKSLNSPIELVEGIEKIAIRLGVKNETDGNLIYVTPYQVKNKINVRSLEINLLLNDEKSLRHQWKHIIALREPS
jgi:type IV pilus assembly protein PilW